MLLFACMSPLEFPSIISPNGIGMSKNQLMKCGPLVPTSPNNKPSHHHQQHHQNHHHHQSSTHHRLDDNLLWRCGHCFQKVPSKLTLIHLNECYWPASQTKALSFEFTSLPPLFKQNWLGMEATTTTTGGVKSQRNPNGSTASAGEAGAGGGVRRTASYSGIASTTTTEQAMARIVRAITSSETDMNSKEEVERPRTKRIERPSPNLVRPVIKTEDELQAEEEKERIFKTASNNKFKNSPVKIYKNQRKIGEKSDSDIDESSSEARRPPPPPPKDEVAKRSTGPAIGRGMMMKGTQNKLDHQDQMKHKSQSKVVQIKCYVCGGEFDTDKLAVHEMQCLEVNGPNFGGLIPHFLGPDSNSNSNL